MSMEGHGGFGGTSAEGQSPSVEQIDHPDAFSVHKSGQPSEEKTAESLKLNFADWRDASDSNARKVDKIKVGTKIQFIDHNANSAYVLEGIIISINKKPTRVDGQGRLSGGPSNPKLTRGGIEILIEVKKTDGETYTVPWQNEHELIRIAQPLEASGQNQE